MSNGLITSFVIGGLLLLSILFLNQRVSNSSSSLAMRQITQQSARSISEIVNYDFAKIGYDEFKELKDPIIVADSNRIVFESNINNAGPIDTVEWNFDTSVGNNVVHRKVKNENTDFALNVKSFELTYYDKNQSIIPAPVSDQSARNAIKHIKVELLVSSKEKVGGAGNFTKSPWTKTFTPKNLKK